MKLAGKLLLVICARCACACAYTADHGEGRLRSAGVAAHGGAGQELARDSLLTGELPPGLAAGPGAADVGARGLRPGLPDAQLQRAPRRVEV